MSHAILLHAALALMALASMWAQMTYRIPGRFVFWALPWLGPAVACLGPLLFINAVAGRVVSSERALRGLGRGALVMAMVFILLTTVMPARSLRAVPAPVLFWSTLAFLYLAVVVAIAELIASAAPPVARRALRWTERIASGLVCGFIVVGAVAFVNGRFDTSPVQEVKSQIRDIGWAEVEMEQALDYRWADLRSWRRPDGIERIFLSRTERAESWPGQAVVLHIRQGALRLPWIVGIAPDGEEYNRQILTIAPNARAARAELIEWYLDHRQWREATAETLEYIARFPAESEFVRAVAAKLGVAHQNGAAQEVLQRVVERHPTPAILGLMGWVMHMNGHREGSLGLLERAIRLDPDDWINYYRLGNVLQALGRYDEAIAAFERMLARRPDYPEVERQLAWLRAKVNVRGPSIP